MCVCWPSDAYALAGDVPDVDDGLVGGQRGVLGVRRGDDQQVGLGDHVVQGQQRGVGGDVRVGAVHGGGGEGQDVLELVGQAGADVVRAALEGHAQDADGHGFQVVDPLEPVDQVQRQALVDGHRCVAEREVVVV